MKCLKCGNSNPENAAYCQNCNAYLAEPPGMEYLDSYTVTWQNIMSTERDHILAEILIPPWGKSRELDAGSTFWEHRI